MEQNFSLTPVHTDKQIQEISNLASVIWHEHFTPIIGIQQVEYMLEKFQSFHALKEQMETAQRSFDDANRELTEAKEKQEALKHAYEKQEQKLVEAELQMDGCRTKRDEKTLAKQQAESQIQVLEEQIRTAKMSVGGVQR